MIIKEENTLGKILQTNEPIIKCYPHHANIISGLMCNDYDFWVLATNYIQLVYNSNIERLDFNYGMDILQYIKNYPLVNSYCYSRNLIKSKWMKFSDFIIDRIKEDCYLNFLVDTFYISAYKKWYKREHYFHNIMVIGYDSETLKVADCFENGKYSIATIDRKEMDQAELPEGTYDWLDGVQCWSFKNDIYFAINIDKGKTKELLKEYLNSKKTVALTKYEDDRRGKEFKYGVAVYDEILRYIEYTEYNLDSRIPYVLIEHKRILCYLCSYFQERFLLENYEINIEKIKKIEKNIIIVQNLFLKFNLTRNKNIKEKIKYNLVACKEMEKQCIEKLINDIKENSDFRLQDIMDKRKTEKSVLIDDETRGNWKEKYGSKGYIIVGDKINIDPVYNIKYKDAAYVLLKRKDNDERGLIRTDSMERVIGYYLNSHYFCIQINLFEISKVSLYCLDFDRLGRVLQIQVWNVDKEKKLYQAEIDNFTSGKYISFCEKGLIHIYVINLEGPDAPISGIFID
ncbi:MAG: hypothetical protein K1W19_09175 [Lachnospiraceae bacterium]